MSNKKIGLIAAISLFGLTAFACPACEQAQPKILRGLIHGGSPDGNLDYVIVVIMTILVLLTLYYSVKFLVKPGEKSTDHIKRTILFID